MKLRVKCVVVDNKSTYYPQGKWMGLIWCGFTKQTLWDEGRLSFETFKGATDFLREFSEREKPLTYYVDYAPPD